MLQTRHLGTQYVPIKICPTITMETKVWKRENSTSTSNVLVGESVENSSYVLFRADAIAFPPGEELTVNSETLSFRTFDLFDQILALV